MFGIIKVGAIDCHEEEELCEEFQVFETPQVKIFTENAADDGVKHTGKIQWKSISSAAASKMQSFVRTVTAENYESFVEENPDKNKILLFTDRKTTAPLFKSLSKTYKDKLVFGEVKKSETSLYEKYGITETPALIAITDPYAYTSEKYDTLGEMKIDQIKKFLSNIAYKTIKVEKVQEIHHLTAKKAKSATTGVCGRKTSNICIIIFTSSGIIEQYQPLLETFSSDPVTITYVITKDEPLMAE